MEHIPGTPEPSTDAPDSNDRNWAMAMHVATLVVLLTGGWLLNVLVPLVGLLWKRGESTFLADHSREQLNFQISLTTYALVAALLFMLTFGIAAIVIVPLVVVFAVVALVATIKAALAASRGQQYRFPLTMRFVS